MLNYGQSKIEGKLPIPTLTQKLIRLNGLGCPANIELSFGIHSTGSCIRCPIPPCYRFMVTELTNDYFKDFPSDTSINVCPTDAIEIDPQNGVPAIDLEKCISCGLCVSRCPVKAITLTEEGAQVNDSENKLFKFTGKIVDPTQVNLVTEQFNNLPKIGVIAECDDQFIIRVYERISSKGSQFNQFPNILTRNLMIALGVPFQIRRLGDVNMRIEGIFRSTGSRIGVAEIEFSEMSSIDSPRDLLDDCAVLHARHSVPLEEIDPLIVSLRLPNKRSEYWQVIKDISNVLGIRISSITIGAMLVILLANRNLKGNIWSSFYADIDSPTIESAVHLIVGKKLCPAGNHFGWFGSIK
jgi:ferredoxin